MRFVFFALALVVTLGSAMNAYADTPASLEDYRRAIAQALTLAQQANALQVSERAPLLTQAADTLDAIHTVQTASGASIAVDNSELVALVKDASKTPNAITRLTALRDAMAQPLASLNANDLATLQTILSRPPFTLSASDNWLENLLRALQDYLARLLSNSAQGIFDFRDIFVGLGVIAVVLVALYFLRNLRRNVVAQESLPPPLTEHDARTPAEAFDNAERFIAAGDYRSAVRQLYLATLLILDRRGRIKYDPALTNREYLKQAARDPRAAAALQPIVETFDRIWYGFEPISVQEFDAYRRRVEQVREI